MRDGFYTYCLPSTTDNGRPYESSTTREIEVYCILHEWQEKVSYPPGASKDELAKDDIARNRVIAFHGDPTMCSSLDLDRPGTLLAVHNMGLMKRRHTMRVASSIPPTSTSATCPLAVDEDDEEADAAAQRSAMKTFAFKVQNNKCELEKVEWRVALIATVTGATPSLFMVGGGAHAWHVGGLTSTNTLPIFAGLGVGYATFFVGLWTLVSDAPARTQRRAELAEELHLLVYNLRTIFVLMTPEDLAAVRTARAGKIKAAWALRVSVAEKLRTDAAAEEARLAAEKQEAEQRTAGRIKVEAERKVAEVAERKKVSSEVKSVTEALRPPRQKGSGVPGDKLHPA